MNKNPLLLYQNKTPDAYSMIAGIEQSGLLFTEAFTWDALRNWIVTSNGLGVVTVQMDYTAGSAWVTATAYEIDDVVSISGVSYKALVAHTSGATSQPGVGSIWEVYWIEDMPNIEMLVLGAHRHDASGFRFPGGAVQLQYWNGSAFVDCLAATNVTAKVNHPSIHEVSAHTPIAAAGVYSYQLTISGLQTSSDVALPELFVGPALVMPGIKYNYDALVEEWTGPKTTTESGRVYESALSRRYMPKPQFTLLDAAKTAEVELFRENVLEERGVFWWFYDPLNDPETGFMMRHNGKNAPMPEVLPNGYSRFRLNMVEAV